MGRWAYNLKQVFSLYHGIDFSEEFVKTASSAFAGEKNIKFFPMSAVDLDTSKLLKKYDLIIINGVTMYINDDNIERLFRYCGELTGESSGIYFQESVSILRHRLTLKDFYSEDLKTRYSAIYRTSQEYEHFFMEYLSDFEFRKDETGLLLDKDTGAREETNARYWFLRRKKIK
jgi:hypothetical protein